MVGAGGGEHLVQIVGTGWGKFSCGIWNNLNPFLILLQILAKY